MISGAIPPKNTSPNETPDEKDEFLSEYIPQQSDLYLAVETGDIHLFGQVIDSVNILLPNDRGASAIHIAVAFQNAHFIKPLVEAGENVDVPFIDRSTALHIAAEVGDVTSITELLELNADVTLRNDKEATPLHTAVINRQAHCIKPLVEGGADVDTLLKGCTPLHIAAEIGDVAAIEQLAGMRANLTLRNIKGATALHVVVAQRHANCIEPLIKMGADINALFIENTTSLHLAAELGDVAVIGELARMGANPTLTNSKGATALHVAVLNEKVDCILPLVAAGVDVNATFPTGETAVHLAALLGNVEAIRALMKAGANVNLANAKGVTPLHCAVVKRHSHCIETLSEKADVNAQTLEKTTPLHLAAANGDRDSVIALLKAKAKNDIANSKGLTPLQVGALCGYAYIIRAFAEWGDPQAKRVLAEVEAEVNPPQQNNSLFGKIKKVFGSLSDRIPFKVKNMGYLLGQAGVTLAIPYLLDVPQYTMAALIGYVGVAELFRVASAEMELREGKPPVDSKLEFDAVIDSTHEKAAQDYVKLCSEKMGLTDVQLIIDHTAENKDGACAAAFSNRIFISKSLLTKETDIQQVKGVLAHELSHANLNRGWFQKGLKFSLGFLTSANFNVIGKIAIAKQIVSFSPWRIPILADAIPLPGNLLKLYLMNVLLTSVNRFVFVHKQREEETLADRGAVALTEDKALKDYLIERYLCAKAAKLPDDDANQEVPLKAWILHGWELKKPIQSFFGLFTVDHPPMIDRIQDIEQQLQTHSDDLLKKQRLQK